MLHVRHLSLLILLLAAHLVASAEDDYTLNFDPAATYTRTDRGLTAIQLGTQNIPVAEGITLQTPVYQDLTARLFQARAGETLMPSFTYKGTWMSGYVYLDFGQDGSFAFTTNDDGTPAEGSDIMAYSFYKGHNSAGESVNNGNVLNPPAFSLPENIAPGFYRMRYKVDWDNTDPGGNVSENNHIINNGGAIVDVRINIHADEVGLTAICPDGNVQTADGMTADGCRVAFGQALTLRIVPDDGFAVESVQLRHGYNLDSDKMRHNTPQWDEVTFTRNQLRGGWLTIPAAYVDGDLRLYVSMTADTTPRPDDYVLIFSDEFDQPDGSEPDPTKWVSSTRRHSTWNRYITDDARVAFVQDGCLVCRAIANPDPAADDVPMITGSRETQNLFSFTYGRVDVRLRTTPHTGNFPAAWMMPQPPAAGWPAAGEIDIFETIDAQDRAWHTVHSTWTHTLNHKSDPQSSFNEWCDVAQWHVYSIEWTPDLLTWLIDERPVGTYARSTDADALAQGQWPFEHPFYIILNQSVGDGSWAAAPDLAFTYETRFDYVRVFQRLADGIAEIPQADGTRFRHTGQSVDGRSSTHDCFDLTGRRVTNDPSRISRLSPGIYIISGRKVVIPASATR